MQKSDNLIFDAEHIWHPYSSATIPSPIHEVSSARGVRLTLADGREIIDGMSSWWSAIHGYNHPRLNQAAKQQIDNMSHVMFGGLTHSPAIELARKLISITAEPLQKVFFADSGSVSVEVAVKMSIQYWFAQGKTDKQRLLTVKNGYHGDTFGAMSVSDPDNGMHYLFEDVLAKHIFAPAPSCQRDEDTQNHNMLRFADNTKCKAAVAIFNNVVEYITPYAASDFGETKNGAWIPKDPSGLTFGDNGAYLKFESSSALGNDSSGNDNDFTTFI